MILNFSIPEIRGKERPRITRSGHAYTPAKTVQYERLVRNCAIQVLSLARKEWNATAPMMVRIAVLKQVPKSWSKQKKRMAIGTPCTVKPDLDNIQKAILDALNGIAFNDDRQVYSITVTKHWTLCADTVAVFVDNGEIDNA